MYMYEYLCTKPDGRTESRPATPNPHHDFTVLVQSAYYWDGQLYEAC